MSKEKEVVQPEVAETKPAEVAVVESPVVAEKIWTKPQPTQPTQPIQGDFSKLSKEQRLLDYLNGKSGQKVRLNDFLKSLYPFPQPGARPVYEQQGEGKTLRVLLDKMVKENRITIANNLHLKLGGFYYGTDSSDPSTKYHNLSTVVLETIIH